MKNNTLIKLLMLLMLVGLPLVANDYDYDEDVATIEPEIFSAQSQKYSFSRSKRILATKVYRLHEKTFYANCDYEIQGKRLVPLLDTCGFKFRKNENRANRIEWEHIVPAWKFGHTLPCWKSGGRKECGRNNANYRQMESDMHNLVPSIGEINGDRSNYPYGNIRGEKRVYGSVDMEIESKLRRAEPKQNIRGEIARTYLFMREKYNIPLSPEQEDQFIKWNNQDPPSRWEKKRNLLIKGLQGDANHYISDYKRITTLIPIDTTVSSVEEGGNENFSEIHKELDEKYGSLLDQLPKPIAGIILFLLALVTWYIRKKR